MWIAIGSIYKEERKLGFNLFFLPLYHLTQLRLKK